MLPIVLEIGKETFVLVIVYHATSPVGFLIDGFVLLMNELSTQYRILIVGNFNLDQFFSKIVVKIAPLIQNLSLSRHSQCSPHIVWGILDLAFDSCNSKIVSVLASPGSDHFVLSLQLWGKDMICIAPLAVLALHSLFSNYGHLKRLLIIDLNKK